MTYTLKGDRKFEWGYVKEKLPVARGLLLDIGPAPANPKPARIAVSRGWDVVAVGLEPPEFKHDRFTFIHSDFNEVTLKRRFDWILNISTVEHFGLVGRYGVTVADADADLRGMGKARKLLKRSGKMLLTIPVGQDAVMGWHHRVYGVERLPLLLKGYRTIEELYYAKCDDQDLYKPCDRTTALAQVPTVEPSYYGLGLFMLGREQ